MAVLQRPQTPGKVPCSFRRRRRSHGAVVSSPRRPNAGTGAGTAQPRRAGTNELPQTVGACNRLPLAWLATPRHIRSSNKDSLMSSLPISNRGPL